MRRLFHRLRYWFLERFGERVIQRSEPGHGDWTETCAGLNKLFDLVLGKKISIVVVEHKDRLTRFQFNVLDKFFSSYGVVIECVETIAANDEEELTNDIMMLMAVFSGRLYGKRSAKRRKEKKLEKELEKKNEQKRS